MILGAQARRPSGTALVRVLVAARVINRLGGFSMGFLGVRLARDLGAGLPLVALVLTAFGACTVPSRLLGGVLAARYGARTAIVAGLLTTAGLAAVLAAAHAAHPHVTGFRGAA